MAKYKHKHHSRGKTTLPMAVILPIGVLALSAAKDISKGNIASVQYGLTGMGPNGKFDSAPVIASYGPIAVGAGIHYLAGRFGVNRALGRAKVPFIRI